jgi:chorismate mutase
MYTGAVSLPDLGPLRETIDRIDNEILDLLHQRLEAVLRVGDIKRSAGVRVYDPERERKVLDRLVAERKQPLRAETVRRVFERIIDESRSHEQHHVTETDPQEPKPAVQER